MFKKSIIASAITLAAVNAYAAVDLTAASPVAAKYASEIDIDTTNGTTVTNAGNNVDVVTDFGFSANAGTTRYIRYDLDNSAEFSAVPTLACIGADNGSDNQTASVSSGGNGASFVIFEITDTDDAIASTGDCTLASATYDLFSDEDVSITYGLYETAGNAVAKTSALATDSGKIIDLTAGLDVDIDAVTPDKIDVTQASKFFNGGTSDDATVIGDVNVGVTGAFWTDGLAAVLGDIVAAGTAVVVTGDFTATQNDDGSYTGAALTRVTLETDGSCTDDVDGTAATALTASTASFTVGTGAVTDATLICLEVEGTPTIAKTSFTGLYDVTAATGSDAGDINLATLSTLEKNGSTKSLNFLLTPGGVFNNFVRIQNTSSIAGDVFLTLYNDSGDSVNFELNKVDGIASSTLGANSSTGLITVDAIYAAAQMADATFNVNGGKLRMEVEGEFSSIDAQALTTTNGDGNTFSTF